MSFAIRFVFLLGVLASPLRTLGAGEVLPKFANDDERKAFILQVQRRIPFATENSIEMLQRQELGIDALKKAFPQYEKWMAEKPSPITIEIFKEEVVREQAMLLQEKLLLAIREQIQALYDEEVKSLPADTPKEKLHAELWLRGLQNLKVLFEKNGASARGIIVGLGQILPKEQRASFYKLGDIQQQLDFIRELKISDQDLRASSFKAETLGLQQDTVTMQQVIEAVEQRTSSTNEMLLSLSYLKALSKDWDNGENRPISTLLTAVDFQFTQRMSDPFLKKVLEDLHANKIANGALAVQNFLPFQNAIPKSYFIVREESQTILKPIARVYEVHPYLGVHRGCAGGDCSTERSAMFPYSPWEHDFYIQDGNGRFVAYISSTRVVAGGEPSLYIRDIQGANLSAAVGEAVLHAFPKIMKHFGVERILLAGHDFTTQQNNSQYLQSMLSKYNRTQALGMTFPDAEVRQYIIAQRQIFHSTSTYDSIEVHRNGFVFTPSIPITKQYKFKFSLGTIPEPDMSTYGLNMLNAARTILNNAKATAKDFPEVDAKELDQLVAFLRNKAGHFLLPYYRQMEAKLAELGFKLTRSFREKNLDLFTAGHLNAPDAFSIPVVGISSENRRDGISPEAEPLRNLSEKILIQLSRKHSDIMAVFQLMLRNKESLENSPRFRELLNLYGERLQPFDVFQLITLAENDFMQAEEIINTPKKREQIESAVAYLISEGHLNLGFPNRVTILANYESRRRSQSRVFDSYGRTTPPVEVSEEEKNFEKLTRFTLPSIAFADRQKQTTQGYLNSMQEALAPYRINITSLRSERLRELINRGILNTTDGMSANNQPRAATILTEELEEGRLKPEEMAYYLIKFGSSKYSSRLASATFKRLAANAKLADLMSLLILSIHAKDLHKETELQAVLQSPQLRQKYLELIDLFTSGEFNTHPEVMAFQKAYGEFGVLIPELLTNLSNITVANNTKLETAVANLKKIAAQLGITLDELIVRKNLLEKIGPSWLRMANPFFHQDSSIVKLSLETFRIALGTEAIQSWNSILSNIEFLKQKKDFQNFLTQITRSFKSGKCVQCGEGLVNFVLTDRITDSVFDSALDIKHLISPTARPFMVTYGIHLAHKRRIAVEITEEHLQMVTNSIADFNFENSNEAQYKIYEMALDVMARSKFKNKKAVELLGNLMRTDPINDRALKAGLAFVRMGGIRNEARTQLISAYDRQDLVNAESGYTRRLHSYFQTRTQLVVSCKKIFEH